MAKVLVVTSGKGGVGKTTTTAALGAALAQRGDKVVVVDFDVGLRNLDLVMGAERRVVFDLINVVQGVAKLPQALIRDKRSEEHTSELQSQFHLVCRLLLEKKKNDKEHKLLHRTSTLTTPFHTQRHHSPN